MNLFDHQAEEARRRRDRGAVQAANAVHPYWKLAAEKALRDLARSGREFTSDDLHERVGHALGGHREAMGALFLTAAKQEVITQAGYRKSTRPEAHGRILTVWCGTGKAPPPPKAPKPDRSRPSMPASQPRRDAHNKGPGSGDVSPRATRRDGPARRHNAENGPPPRSKDGKWTTADTPKPCLLCNRPAFLRLDGQPRHKLDCAGGEA